MGAGDPSCGCAQRYRGHAMTQTDPRAGAAGGAWTAPSAHAPSQSSPVHPARLEVRPRGEFLLSAGGQEGSLGTRGTWAPAVGQQRGDPHRGIFRGPTIPGQLEAQRGPRVVHLQGGDEVEGRRCDHGHEGNHHAHLPREPPVGAGAVRSFHLGTPPICTHPYTPFRSISARTSHNPILLSSFHDPGGRWDSLQL